MGVPISDNFKDRIEQYKVAFFDIDGTIFKSDYSLSPKTIKAFKKLQERGIKTCLATGRPYFGSLKIIETLGIKDASMFSSGGVVLEPENGKVLFTESVNGESLVPLLSDLRKSGAHIELYGADKYFIEVENEISKMHLLYLQKDPVINDFEVVHAAHAINKVVVVTRTKEELNSIYQIAERHPEFSYAFSYGASHPELTFVNVTNKKASRKNVFNFFLKHFNVKAEETMAFGDADADADFLQSAGLGVAVANASEKAKAASRIITRSVEEDGVVHVLEAMGISNSFNL